MSWIDRLDHRLAAIIVVGTILALALVTIGLGPRSVPDEPLLDGIRMEAAPYVLTFALNRGSDRPLLSLDDGTRLAEISAWQSAVVVDGERTPLYNLPYNTARDGNLLYVTWSHPDYAIEQRVELAPDGLRIDWTWLRRAGAPAREAILEIAHHQADAAQRWWAGAAAGYARVADGQGVRISFDRAPADVVAVGDALRVRAEAPETGHGRAALVLREHIALGPVPADAPRLPVHAPLDPAAWPERLRATLGNLTLQVNLTRPQGHPLVVARGHEPMLDLDAGESLLLLDGNATPLHLLPFRFVHNATHACTTWTHPRVELAQCATLRDEAVEVAWRTTPRDAAVDLTLQLAHRLPEGAEPTARGAAAAWAHGDGARVEAHVRAADDARARWRSGADAATLLLDLAPPAGAPAEWTQRFHLGAPP